MPNNDEYIVIQLRSRPLKRAHFTLSDVRYGHVERKGATGLLMDKLDEREQKRKEEEAKTSATFTNIEKLEEDQNIGILTPEPEEEQKKSRFKKLKKDKKPFFTIWDYSEVEYDELEKETAKEINQDGFYDEIMPEDQGEDSKFAKNKKKLGMLIPALVLSAVVLLSILIFMVLSVF